MEVNKCLDQELTVEEKLLQSEMNLKAAKEKLKKLYEEKKSYTRQVLVGH